MPKIQKITAQELISEADMKSLEHQPLGEEYIRTTVTQDTECWDEQGRCVFVFLRGVIPVKVQRPAFRAADTKLKFNSTAVSQRAALKGVGGENSISVGVIHASGYPRNSGKQYLGPVSAFKM
jgi:hypothetical protein